MMLAPTLKELLKTNAAMLGINPDYVFSYSIDSNVDPEKISDPVIRISEIDDTPSNYGSNHSMARRADAQIQIFFPPTYTGDTSSVRYNLTDLMEDNQWACTLDQAIEHDPSVNALSNITHWRKSHKD